MEHRLEIYCEGIQCPHFARGEDEEEGEFISCDIPQCPHTKEERDRWYKCGRCYENNMTPSEDDCTTCDTR